LVPFIGCISLVFLGCADGEMDPMDNAGGTGGQRTIGAGGGGGTGGSGNVGAGGQNMMATDCTNGLQCAAGFQCSQATRLCVPMGQGTGGNAGQAGSAGQAGPRCFNDAECGAGFICNENTGQCIEGQRPGGAGGSAGSAGTGGGSAVTNACTNAADNTQFNRANGCRAACADMHAQDQETCQRTPARLVDCLAEAAQELEMCESNCGDAGTAATGCMQTCGQQAPLADCVNNCMTQEMGLSADCASCFGELAVCNSTACGAGCVQAPNIQSCIGCRAQQCGVAFQACSGLNTTY